MNLRIPIPQWLVNSWERFGDWSNVTIWQRNIRIFDFAGNYAPKDIELRRIDILIVISFLFSVTWYGYWYGWRGALQGAVAFIVIGALALFARR